MRTIAFLSTLTFLFSGIVATELRAESADAQVAEYIEKFPYQDTFNYMMRYTDGDPAKLNVWVLGEKPELVKAGEDKIVRMNNDTFYKLAFANLGQGPVTLKSEKSADDRFSSFQIMDDRNVNYRNVISPSGSYTLYYGEKSADIQGEAIESPSELAVVIVRVEVKDRTNADDMRDAEAIFNGITISGPEISAIAELDTLGRFDEKVVAAAERQMKETSNSTPFSKQVAGPDDVPDKVSYLQLATGTKYGWGGPVTSHSAYETIFTDKDGKPMVGKNGTYAITTEEPPVDAFWSITVYDTDRGGFLHPNKDGRHHINNTGAVKNADGNITFLFKTDCRKEDQNCLEVPEGKFDLAARYYLPKDAIRNGTWTLPRAELKSK
ncbi:MAG: DUF1214 domain-containing protein [Hyphomicrobiaceae bacterium]|jgi:hypothetical protein|nr:DUF1214 domain-containing protein [Hyphomicrobiaceae bacterium]MDX2449793.1 DUF1214 domain-containing protein [Hyphomicrobiaceae bacterium]